jgi:hypothetical protein
VQRIKPVAPILILTSLVLLAGCMDIAIKARVKPDGSATMTYRTTMDASLVALSKMGDSTKTKKDSGLKEPFDDLSKKPGVKLLSKTTKDLPDGKRLSEAVFQAKSVTAFGDSDGPIRFDKSEGQAHLVWPLKNKSPSQDTASAQDSSAVQSGQMVDAMFAGNTFDFELEMPGKIITAPGADSIRGSKAFYHKPLADLFKADFTIDATSK